MKIMAARQRPIPISDQRRRPKGRRPCCACADRSKEIAVLRSIVRRYPTGCFAMDQPEAVERVVLDAFTYTGEGVPEIMRRRKQAETLYGNE
jgi:hypothetical protein